MWAGALWYVQVSRVGVADSFAVCGHVRWVGRAWVLSVQLPVGTQRQYLRVGADTVDACVGVSQTQTITHVPCNHRVTTCQLR